MTQKSSNWQIKMGAIISYVGIGINILVGFIYTPWMLKIIGESEYGLYSLATSLISLFMVDFGISAATSKYIARYRAEGNIEKIGELLGIIYKLYLIIDLVVAIIFAVVYLNIETIYAKLTVDELHTFKIIFLMVIFYNLFSFPFSTLSGILNAYEHFVWLKLIAIVSKIGTVIVTIIALSLGCGILGLIFIHIVFGVACILVKLILIKKKTPIKVKILYWNKNDLKNIFTFSMWATVVSIMSRLVFNITPSILSAFVGTTEVAIFSLASTLEGYVYTFADGVNGLFLSKTTRAAISDNRDDEILELMIRVGRVVLSIISLIVVGFMVAGKEFISLWLGDGYQLVYVCAVLMILPDLIYFPQQIGRTVLLVENKLKYQAYAYIFIGITNVIFSFVLIPHIGVLGSGISIGFTYLFRLILMTCVFHKKLHLNMFRFFKECYLQMLIPISATLFFGMFLFNFWEKSSWFVFLFKCGIVGIFYFGAMWFFGWNSSEKTMILGTLRILRRNNAK